MKLNRSDYIPIAITAVIIILEASYYFDEHPNNYLETLSSITGIASALITIIGVFIVVDWRKEKGRTFSYKKCAELHFALFTFPVFIQISTNYIYGGSAKCSQYAENEDMLKSIALDTNISIFKDIQGQLMELMGALSYYPRIRKLVSEEYATEIEYLFILYTKFCKGVYCPIDSNGEPNEKILEIQNILKSDEYKKCIRKINDKKIEEIFIFED